MQRSNSVFRYFSTPHSICGRSRAKWHLGLALALALALGLTPQSRGRAVDAYSPTKQADQSTKRRQRSGNAIELSAELVVLNVAVVSQTNQPITDLTKDDFTVYEDNVKQEVAFFGEEETPSSIGLVIDTSGSMRRKLSKVIAAALRLIRESHHEDEVFVIEFNDEVELIQGFTNNIDEVQDALDDMVAHSQTVLLDAVYLSVDYAQKHGKFQRKAIVLITDGEERDSYYTRSQVLDRLRESDAEVFVVGFPEGLDMERYNIFRGTGKRKMGRQEKRARKLLDSLARESGGRTFYPESLNELDSVARTIARELRTQYVVGYYPTNAVRDNTWRSVRVEIRPDKNGNKRVARTRTGYVATSGKQPKRTR